MVPGYHYEYVPFRKKKWSNLRTIHNSTGVQWTTLFNPNFQSNAREAGKV